MPELGLLTHKAKGVESNSLTEIVCMQQSQNHKILHPFFFALLYPTFVTL